VDYAAVGVAALEPERELAIGLEVEDDPARAQLGHGRGRLLGQDLDRRGAAEPAPGGDRVGRVLAGRITRLQRRGKAALRPEAGALRERRARDEADRAALLRRLQGSPQTSGAAADDGDVVLGAGSYRCPASRRSVSI
jgi:hypothetical protein